MTTVQSLASRAEALRQSLDSSHQISQEACRVLDQYCSQLGELERIVQPVVFKTQALTQTRENVKQARAKAEEVLDHLDASRKVIWQPFMSDKYALRANWDNPHNVTSMCRWSLASYKVPGQTCQPSWQPSRSLTWQSRSCSNTGLAICTHCTVTAVDVRFCCLLGAT